MVGLKALLFDKDGTLFDFSGTWAGVTEAVIHALAPTPDAAVEMATAGGFDLATRRYAPGSVIVAGTPAQIAATWAPFRPDLSQHQLAREIDRICLEAAEDASLLAPASRDLPGLLNGLAARGLALGVATNDTYQGATQQLTMAGVEGAFSYIAGSDSVSRPKPAPDMILGFADHLGHTAAGHGARSIAMIGDSIHDLEAGRAAGCGLTIGVLTGPATARDLGAYADHIIPSIDALPELLDALAAQ